MSLAGELFQRKSRTQTAFGMRINHLLGKNIYSWEANEFII